MWGAEVLGMRERGRYTSPLQAASRFSKLLLSDSYISSRIKSIVAFGSVTRQRDFVKGLSDIDMLVIVDSKSKRLEDRVWHLASSTDYHISPVVFTQREFISQLEAGNPGPLLMLKGRALHDVGTFSRARSLGFKPTERTARVLLDHAFCALSIALNDYFSGINLFESVNSAYHCGRHALRAMMIKETGVLAESNKQMLQYSRKYPELCESFKKLIRARKAVDRLLRRYKRERARRSATTLRDDIGGLLLSAEGVAVSSHELCTGERQGGIRELLDAARQKFDRFETIHVGWEGSGWRLLVKHKGKLKHFTLGKIQARLSAPRTSA